MANIQGISFTDFQTAINKADISDAEKKELESIFTRYDKYDKEGEEITDGKGDDFLNIDELKEVSNYALTNLAKAWNKVSQFINPQSEMNIYKLSTEQQTQKSDATNVAKIQTREEQTIRKNPVKLQLNSNTLDAKAKITNMIMQEAKKHNVNLKTIDVEYWADIIHENSKYGSEPKEIAKIIIGYISRETKGKFTKHDISPDGKFVGAMQIGMSVTTSIYGPENKIYQMIDKQLYDDIKIALKKNGKPNSAAGLFAACKKDDNLAIKVGLLYHKRMFIGSVAAIKKCSKETAVKGLEDKSIKLSQEEMKRAYRSAARNYNGSSDKVSYSKEVLDSLATHEFDYTKQVIIREKEQVK